MAAAAVADERDGAVAALRDALQPALQAEQAAVGAVDVEPNAGRVRPMSHAPQPLGHHGERVVAGEEAGNQHDRAAVPARNAVPAVDGIDEQTPELRLPAQLVQMTPPPQLLRDGHGETLPRGADGLVSRRCRGCSRSSLRRAIWTPTAC